MEKIIMVLADWIIATRRSSLTVRQDNCGGNWVGHEAYRSPTGVWIEANRTSITKDQKRDWLLETCDRVGHLLIAEGPKNMGYTQYVAMGSLMYDYGADIVMMMTLWRDYRRGNWYQVSHEWPYINGEMKERNTRFIKRREIERTLLCLFTDPIYKVKT